MGWIWVTTTSVAVEFAVTRLPGIHQPQTDPARDRRIDVAIAHLDLVVGDHAFVVLDGALGPATTSFSWSSNVWRGMAFLRPGDLVAFQIHLRLGEQILVALQGALRLGKLGLVLAGVDIDQRIALLAPSALRDSAPR